MDAASRKRLRVRRMIHHASSARSNRACRAAPGQKGELSTRRQAVASSPDHQHDRRSDERCHGHPLSPGEDIVATSRSKIVARCRYARGPGLASGRQGCNLLDTGVGASAVATWNHGGVPTRHTRLAKPTATALAHDEMDTGPGSAGPRVCPVCARLTDATPHADSRPGEWLGTQIALWFVCSGPRPEHTHPTSSFFLAGPKPRHFLFHAGGPAPPPPIPPALQTLRAPRALRASESPSVPQTRPHLGRLARAPVRPWAVKHLHAAPSLSFVKPAAWSLFWRPTPSRSCRGPAHAGDRARSDAKCRPGARPRSGCHRRPAAAH